MSGKNLVICCAGDQSLHPRWSGEERNFDLLVIYYGSNEGTWRSSADYYLAMKGTKWQLIHMAVRDLGDVISRYDSIWFPDDDIDADTKKINELFRCFNKYELALAQPALAAGSHISHPITRQRRFSFMRLTNFVEVMVPIMRRDIFFSLIDTFTLNMSAWGLDFLWASRIESAGLGKIAIIDHVGVTHTRPVNPSGGFYSSMNLNPYSERDDLVGKFGLSTKTTIYAYIYRIVNFELHLHALKAW